MRSGDTRAGPVRFSVWLALTGASLLAVVAGALLTGQEDAAAQAVVSNEPQLRGAFADPNETVIVVAADIVLADCTATGGRIERDSTAALTIVGNGHTISQTCVGEGVMSQAGTGPLTIDGLTVTGGNTLVTGGGIFAEGDLTIRNSTIRDNVSTAGGGITVGGQLTLTGSTISGNSAAVGGGINNAGGVTAINSTISNNTSVPPNNMSAATSSGRFGGAAIFGAAQFSGAGINSDGTVTVINSTINGNTAELTGGIDAAGSITLVYATVAGNTGDFANLGTDGNLISFGSVVGLGQGMVGCGVSGQTTSHGFNFSSDSSCGFGSGPGDQPAAGDPLLGSLADNGGPTMTQLPQPGSPLLDAIPVGACQADGAAGITTDQRGVGRPQGAGCDIGAVEVVVDTSLLPPGQAPVLPPGQAPVLPPGLAPVAAPVPGIIRFTG